MWHQNSDVSLVIRTDFARPRQWEEIQTAIAEPQTEDGFTAFVAFIDDRAYESIASSQLVGMVPADVNPPIAFLVDAKTLTHPDFPILVVNLYDYAERLEDQGKGPQSGAHLPRSVWFGSRFSGSRERGHPRLQRRRGSVRLSDRTRRSPSCHAPNPVVESRCPTGPASNNSEPQSRA